MRLWLAINLSQAWSKIMNDGIIARADFQDRMRRISVTVYKNWFYDQCQYFMFQETTLLLSIKPFHPLRYNIVIWTYNFLFDLSTAYVKLYI